MKVADILDKITNAQGVADTLLEAIKRNGEINIALDFNPNEGRNVCVDENVIKDTLGIIAEYLTLLESKEVK